MYRVQFLAGAGIYLIASA